MDVRVIKKAKAILSHLESVKKTNLNIDKDVISIKVNSQYRLVYRASTKLIARLVTHNDYNRIISYKFVGGIQ